MRLILTATIPQDKLAKFPAEIKNRRTVCGIQMNPTLDFIDVHADQLVYAVGLSMTLLSVTLTKVSGCLTNTIALLSIKVQQKDMIMGTTFQCRCIQ